MTRDLSAFPHIVITAAACSLIQRTWVQSPDLWVMRKL